MSDLTAERLRELLAYDPLTGIFTRRAARGGYAKGSRAGCVNKVLGYEMMTVDRRVEYAHRLAWLFVSGRWPDHEIDHINGVRSDNRITNLRLATHHQQQQNSRARNKSGMPKGVKRHFNRYEASIKINGVKKFLGQFATPELAHAAYCESAKIHFGEFFCDGTRSASASSPY